MDNQQVQQRVSLGSQGTNLVISHSTFDEDGFSTGTKAALVEISLGKSGLEMLQKAAKKEWKLFGAKNQGGFVQAEPVRELTAEEIATTKSSGRSYTSLIECTSEEEIVHGTNASLRPEAMSLPTLK